MKKLFTLLWLSLTAFTFNATAQNISCNANFTVQFQTNFTVKLNPALNTDSPFIHHYWSFGDGTPGSQLISPTHTYSLPGTYAVVHTVIRVNSAGVGVCTQSFTSQVVIQAPCNLVVNFTWTASTNNPLMLAFHNMSVPLEPSDSSTWIFGDNTTSHDVNPVHTYANAGTYQVCLIVKKNFTTPNTSPCIRYLCKTVVVNTLCNLVVDFSWNATTSNPLMIEFHNLSTPLAAGDTTTWTFGDGSSSTAVNPAHTYANAGTYQVCLIVRKAVPPGTAPCVRYLCKTIIVYTPCNLVVDFSWTATTSNPLMIEFHNLSTPLAAGDSSTWNFGDGATSYLVNPVHTYANAGTYEVCLIVKKAVAAGASPCIRYICKQVIVTAPCNFQPSWTWATDPGNPSNIHFTNTTQVSSSSATAIWFFGDGTSATSWNANHVYAQPGRYYVCLRVQLTPNCIRYKCDSVTVPPPPCNFQPSWTWRLDSINLRKAWFTNTTIAPNSGATVTWFFGDGTSATSWNAVHEYAQPGRYNVCLRVQLTPNCVRYKCDSITIPVPMPPCNNQSNFNFLRAATNSQTYTFIPDFQNSAAQYTWTFGDGTGSHDMIATHHYAQAGTYTVCLTVWRSPTCASTTCRTVAVTSQINCDSIHVTFTYQFDPILHNKVYFYAIANFPILDQTWTIKKLPNGTPVILHQNNPVYIFPDTGYYSVCLRAVTLGGCIKEYCSTVHIEQMPVTCQLQAYPNPATTQVSVNVALTQPEMINVYVYNNLNVLVKEKHQQGSTGNNVVTLSIGDLVAGLYHMQVIYGNHICNATFQKL